MKNQNKAGYAGGLVTVLLAVLGTGSAVSAQWTVTNLHPADAPLSFAVATRGGQQTGFVRLVEGGPYHASLWTGTAGSWVDLHPAGWDSSLAGTTDGHQQGGWTYNTGVFHASLWSGTAASRVDLHPAGAIDSLVHGVSDGQQVGYAGFGRSSRASLWSGTAASWVDLTPAESEEAAADAIGDGQQGGYVMVGGYQHASLWSGSAASWVDLHPTGWTSSRVTAVSGGQQAGSTMTAGLGHASFWSGTAASWVDLHPAGAIESYAYGIGAGKQVGDVTIGGVSHASLWSGTAASWLDLHAFLPAGFASSYARGIYSDGINLYVAGGGQNTVTGRSEALLWTAPICYPPTISAQPLPIIVCRTTGATFSVTATDTSALGYQWRKAGSPIDSAANPSATTDTLQLVHVQTTDAGAYDCVVTNACGTSVISNSATLSTRLCLCLLADVAGGGDDGQEGDGIVDGSDFIAFINSFATGDVAVDSHADIVGGGLTGLDPDGIIDGNDFIIFINTFAAGC